MLSVPGVLLTLIVSVLLILIFISYSSHVEFKLEVCSLGRSSDSCARLWSSTKSNSLRVSGSRLASFVIQSMYMMNNHGDSTQLCPTSGVMSKQYVSPSDVHAVLILWHECCPKVGLGRYTFLVFAIVCLSSLCQTPFFSGQQIRCLVLYCIHLLFRSVVLRRKLCLCSHFLF